jgi:hypothetical protein
MGTNRSDDVPREDFRLTLARKALAGAQGAVNDMTQPYKPEIWAARLEVAVEQLLLLIEERAERRS